MTDPVVLAPPQPSAAGARYRVGWGSRLLSLVSAYLPLILMALLALGTWWLVKNTPLFEAGGPAAPPQHKPDYSMQQFSVQRFYPTGALRARIEGAELRHYPDTDTLEIDNVKVRSVAPDGRITLATARSALSNADGSEVQLMGGAHVVSEATPTAEAIEFRGEFLHIFLNTEQMRSHLPVTVTRGRNELRAAAMEYDNLSRQVKFKGRTNVRLLPDAGAPAARR
jgi:lipopolysaccharide export system protein LptC